MPADLKGVSLKDRIAALQQREDNKASARPQASPPRGNALRDKIRKFEEKGGTPIPRGSFGLSLPSQSSQRSNNELYANRLAYPSQTGAGTSLGRSATVAVHGRDNSRSRCVSMFPPLSTELSDPQGDPRPSPSRPTDGSRVLDSLDIAPPSPFKNKHTLASKDNGPTFGERSKPLIQPDQSSSTQDTVNSIAPDTSCGSPTVPQIPSAVGREPEFFVALDQSSDQTEAMSTTSITPNTSLDGEVAHKEATEMTEATASLHSSHTGSTTANPLSSGTNTKIAVIIPEGNEDPEDADFASPATVVESPSFRTALLEITQDTSESVPSPVNIESGTPSSSRTAWPECVAVGDSFSSGGVPSTEPALELVQHDASIALHTVESQIPTPLLGLEDSSTADPVPPSPAPSFQSDSGLSLISETSCDSRVTPILDAFPAVPPRLSDLAKPSEPPQSNVKSIRPGHDRNSAGSVGSISSLPSLSFSHASCSSSSSPTAADAVKYQATPAQLQPVARPRPKPGRKGRPLGYVPSWYDDESDDEQEGGWANVVVTRRDY